MRGRFAPSPTGDMHLGNARTALLAWLSARAQGGRVVLRLEDLDRARVVPDAEARLYRVLRALGLDWDEGPDRGGPWAPYRQSERQALYDQAVERLLESKDAFLCSCSRADVARAAEAPHAGEEGPRYPGTCREVPETQVRAKAASAGRAPVVRFRGQGRRMPFVDGVHGAWGDDEVVDDFVIRRADGTAAYQLAVVVDDAAMQIAEVVRGDDLLSSTPRQLLLYAALGLSPPAFFHVPLVLTSDGERLAKRTRPASVQSLLDAGVTASRIVGFLAASAGLCSEGDEPTPGELVSRFSFRLLPRTPIPLDPSTLAR